MSDAWHMARARNRFKTARDAIGGIQMSDDVSLLAMDLLHLLDGVIALLDKRVAKAKGERLTKRDGRALASRPPLTKSN